VNGVVYIAFASHCDNNPYHGWILAYDAKPTYSTGCLYHHAKRHEGGIWQSGGSVAVDEANNLYVMTGNGTFDANLPNGMDFRRQCLEARPRRQHAHLGRLFHAFQSSHVGSEHADLGSGGPVVLPNQSGAPVSSLLVGAGKEGTIYLLDRNMLGQFCSGCTSDTQIVQSIPSALGANFSNTRLLE